MKKLKLDLGDLKVESFETVKNSKKSKGTVAGYAPTWLASCDDACQYTAEGHKTCNNLCNTNEYISCEIGVPC